MQGKGVNFTAHAVAKRTVNQLVLLDHVAVFKLLADDRCLKVIAIAINNDLSVRYAGLDKRLQFSTIHKMHSSQVSLNL